MLIISRDDADRAGHFEGYAFIGSDYVAGVGGVHRYQEATGRFVGAGEDGCYVSARRIGAGDGISSPFRDRCRCQT